ncbi:MAG: hypothetical protein ABIE55_00250 [Candidatus Aenigmatarchaeota archaeon]
MKGQYLTIEYLLFFTIGVIMIVSVYYIFSGLNQQYEKATTEYQLQMTGQMIMGSVINVFEASNSTNSQVIYNLTIPTKLSNCIYSIRELNGFLLLECVEIRGMNANLTLYNFNIKIKNNIIYSTNGLLEIYANGGEIDIK